jgi:hypothetical protein
MTVNDLINAEVFDLVHTGTELEKEINQVFCCDLLSIAMSKIPEGAAWVTVMGNINTLAVATLTDTACIILAERANLDLPALEKAKSENVTVLCTEKPIFDAALAIHNLIHDTP